MKILQASFSVPSIHDSCLVNVNNHELVYVGWTTLTSGPKSNRFLPDWKDNLNELGGDYSIALGRWEDGGRRVVRRQDTRNVLLERVNVERFREYPRHTYLPGSE